MILVIDCWQQHACNIHHIHLRNPCIISIAAGLWPIRAASTCPEGLDMLIAMQGAPDTICGLQRHM